MQLGGLVLALLGGLMFSLSSQPPNTRRIAFVFWALRLCTTKGSRRSVSSGCRPGWRTA